MEYLICHRSGFTRVALFPNGSPLLSKVYSRGKAPSQVPDVSWCLLGLQSHWETYFKRKSAVQCLRDLLARSNQQRILNFMSVQMEIVLCLVQDGTWSPAPSRHETFASFSVIFLLFSPVVPFVSASIGKACPTQETGLILKCGQFYKALFLELN